MSQSSDIGENSDRDISDFLISDQSLINENCPNSRIGNDIDMKLKPVTKINKRNTEAFQTHGLKNFHFH